MRTINEQTLKQYIRQVIAQEEHAYSIKEHEPVDYAEYRNIVEAVSYAAARWAVTMSGDHSEVPSEIAPPLPETE